MIFIKKYQYNKLLIIFLLFASLNFNNLKIFFGLKKESYFNNLRNLWEEEMEYDPKKRNSSEDIESLETCASSNYKYFSFILSGAPVSFDHFINEDNAVRH